MKKITIAESSENKESVISLDNDRVVTIQKSYERTSFEKWQEIIKTNFPNLSLPAEICLSIIAQILIKEIVNPFALVLVGVPSGGKTICVNFFNSIDELTYATDKFTPASFVTNASNVKREKLAELDLLPRLKHKAFLVRDLATLFSKRDDDLNECLGILTRVLDGEGFSTDTGIHGRRNLSGPLLFMMIAASTPLSSRIWKMMGSLGSRMFFFNMQAHEKNVDELVHQLQSVAFKQKEHICRNATRGLLYTLWDDHKAGVVWNRAEDSVEVLEGVVHCARLLAKLRGVVSVWKEKDVHEKYAESDYSPAVIENPDRISMLFYNLCRGHALAMGRYQISKDDLRLVARLAIDSAPTVRGELFRKLLELNGRMTTSQVQTHFRCSKPTALKEMRTFECLGICAIHEVHLGRTGQSELEIKLLEDFEWFATEECKKLLGIQESEVQMI